MPDQNDMPIVSAMRRFQKSRVVKFDVPGHKGGRGNPELTEFLGEQCVVADVNSMKPLDNLAHPVSVIREAEELAASAFGAASAFCIVGGTTAAVQAMILSTCAAGDKIILPRNVHTSVMGALVLCGAIPVYVAPGVDHELGIPLGMRLEDVRAAIGQNPDAKAVFVNNPTYYGICSDLGGIIDLAHGAGMKVLADEAHGTHFYFGADMPDAAMRVGADMAAVSMHKTGTSLTQSSFLLCSESVDPGYVRQIINLTQTTSASYLLLSSLDIARRNMSLRGAEMVRKTLELTTYARDEINALGGYRAFGRELCEGESVYDFDLTKLSVHTREIGLAGIEVYDLLRDEYGIQIEFGDIGNILAIISSGDRMLEIERLISALSEIRRLYSRDTSGMFDHEYITPEVVLPPQRAFYSARHPQPIRQCAGMVCGESVMCYPPGIPILAPGEKVTREIIDYILYAKEKGCRITGTQDPDVATLQVIG